jgi:hypothetical protein
MYHKCMALLLAFGASAFSVGLADARVAVLVVDNKCGPLRVVSVNRCTKDGVIATGMTQISLRATFKSGGGELNCRYDAWNPRWLAFSVTYNSGFTYFSTVCTPGGDPPGDFCDCKPAWAPP